MKNPLLKIQDYGQSIWLDYIDRDMLDSGEVKQLIEQDGLRGVTVNPSILNKAISGSDKYDEDVHTLASKGLSAAEIYESLAIDDVQRAADLFRPLYDASEGDHGFVSLEVSPLIAYDTAATIEEAKRFWRKLDRPNVMIKVPATREGLAAIEQLTAQGVNVNVTLLFGLPRYRAVADAYQKGLETRAGRGEPIDSINSVASFFLSRIDVLVDPLLEDMMSGEGEKAEVAERLHGQIAVASARMAYQIYTQIYAAERFQSISEKGARTQRLLWASTSTKNPDYSDVKYVEALIGPDTVNTAPPETLDAFRDHGNPARRIDENVAQAREFMNLLGEVGIEINEVTAQLEKEGVEKFSKAYDQLLELLEKMRAEAPARTPDTASTD